MLNSLLKENQIKFSTHLHIVLVYFAFQILQNFFELLNKLIRFLSSFCGQNIRKVDPIASVYKLLRVDTLRIALADLLYSLDKPLFIERIVQSVTENSLCLVGP